MVLGYKNIPRTPPDTLGQSFTLELLAHVAACSLVEPPRRATNITALVALLQFLAVLGGFV